jgi:hypothetical protein
MVAAGLVVSAAALAATGAHGAAPSQAPSPVAGAPKKEAVRTPPGPVAAAALVTAPVRIADAETVRLLRPGDRVDVIAAPETPAGTGADDGLPAARVVARGARVTEVPEPAAQHGDAGALVMLAVPRGTAAALAGAGVTARLAVTVW